MNPVMDGKDERLDIAYTHSSFYEDSGVSLNGSEYNRIIDFESSELAFLSKWKAGIYSITINGSVTHNYDGVLDNVIIYVHDRTGSTRGRWKKKKEAPRNEYDFSVTDENGKEVLSIDKRWQYKMELFISRELPYDFLVRAGTRAPIKRGSSIFSAVDYEYALTLQKYWKFYNFEFLMDISSIWLAQDRTNLPLKDKRLTSNLYLSYKESFFFQRNLSESVFIKTKDRVLDEHGAIYILGYKKNNWFVGFVEDLSLYNNPDVSVMAGIMLKRSDD